MSKLNIVFERIYTKYKYTNLSNSALLIICFHHCFRGLIFAHSFRGVFRHTFAPGGFAFAGGSHMSCAQNCFVFLFPEFKASVGAYVRLLTWTRRWTLFMEAFDPAHADNVWCSKSANGALFGTRGWFLWHLNEKTYSWIVNMHRCRTIPHQRLVRGRGACWSKNDLEGGSGAKHHCQGKNCCRQAEQWNKWKFWF